MKLALIICIGIYVFTHFISLLIRDGYTKNEKITMYQTNSFFKWFLILLGISNYGSLWIGIVIGLIYLYQII